MGMFNTQVQTLKSPAEKFHPQPQISGKSGGESLNLHQFSRDGVVLLGARVTFSLALAALL